MIKHSRIMKRQTLHSIMLPVICAAVGYSLAVADLGGGEQQKEERYVSTEADIVWGAETNGLRSGIWVPRGILIIKGGRPSYSPEIVVGSTDKTHHISYYRPTPDQRFTLRLVDQSGRDVPRTAKAAEIGKPLEVGAIAHRVRRTKYFLVTVKSGELSPVSFHIEPADYFNITRPGLYKLTVSQRIYIADTNEVLIPVTLPPVIIPVSVTE